MSRKLENLIEEIDRIHINASASGDSTQLVQCVVDVAEVLSKFVQENKEYFDRLKVVEDKTINMPRLIGAHRE